MIALGGQILRDVSDFEMGTLPIRLTEDARRDPILCDTPDGFLAVSGKPFWAFQFHPEVDRAMLVERLTVFKDQYTKGDEQLTQVLNGARETPESNRLVTKFVDRVLLEGTDS